MKPLVTTSSNMKSVLVFQNRTILGVSAILSFTNASEHQAVSMCFYPKYETNWIQNSWFSIFLAEEFAHQGLSQSETGSRVTAVSSRTKRYRSRFSPITGIFGSSRLYGFSPNKGLEQACRPMTGGLTTPGSRSCGSSGTVYGGRAWKDKPTGP